MSTIKQFAQKEDDVLSLHLIFRAPNFIHREQRNLSLKLPVFLMLSSTIQSPRFTAVPLWQAKQASANQRKRIVLFQTLPQKLETCYIHIHLDSLKEELASTSSL